MATKPLQAGTTYSIRATKFITLHTALPQDEESMFKYMDQVWHPTRQEVLGRLAGDSAKRPKGYRPPTVTITGELRLRTSPHHTGTCLFYAVTLSDGRTGHIGWDDALDHLRRPR